jgi:hypothetical protein
LMMSTVCIIGIAIVTIQLVRFSGVEGPNCDLNLHD